MSARELRIALKGSAVILCKLVDFNFDFFSTVSYALGMLLNI